MSKTSGSPSRKRSIVANLALAAVSLCLSLALAEFALRAVVPPDASRPFDFRIPHPVLGWSLQPNATYVYELPEGKVSVTYNSRGWRDLEHEVKKPDGVFRILVLGDSFMEANSVELEDTFHRHVETLARATGRNVEVINMGVAGYGTLQEYLVFLNYGHVYDPDLVLLGFFAGNDLMNNSLELASMLTEEGQVTNARPFLDLDKSGGWAITPVDFEGAQQAYAEHKASLEESRNKLSEQLILFSLLATEMARIPLPKFLRGREGQDEPIDKSRQELALLGVNYCAEPAEYTRAWHTTERIFEAFQEEVEAYGSKLIVFTVPGIEEVSLEYMEGVRSNVAFPDKLCLEEAPGHARLHQTLTKLNIEHISLLPEFRRAMREEGANLYQSDRHWNANGHALAAETVISELSARGFLPAPVKEQVPQ